MAVGVAALHCGCGRGMCGGRGALGRQLPQWRRGRRVVLRRELGA
jgi:hypothetical protein